MANDNLLNYFLRDEGDLCEIRDFLTREEELEVLEELVAQYEKYPNQEEADKYKSYKYEEIPCVKECIDDYFEKCIKYTACHSSIDQFDHEAEKAALEKWQTDLYEESDKILDALNWDEVSQDAASLSEDAEEKLLELIGQYKKERDELWQILFEDCKAIVERDIQTC